MDGKKIKLISRFTPWMNLKWLIALSGQNSIIPFYHVVSNEQLPHIQHLYRYRNVAEFEKDLDKMLIQYNPLSLSEFLNQNKIARKKRSMLLTFDDGLIECHRVIAPLLKKKGIPAVFFLNNHFIDNKGLFFRYKMSILVDRIHTNSEKISLVAKFLGIPDEKVFSTLKGISYSQLSIIDAVAEMLEVDYVEYMQTRPVYMSTDQVNELISWDFEIGGHSLDHPRYCDLNQEDMMHQTQHSMEDLTRRFNSRTTSFAFPFTSEHIPEIIIDELLSIKSLNLLLGTSGIKETLKAGFIQRIDMETFNLPAIEALKIKYLNYILKRPLKKHIYKY